MPRSVDPRPFPRLSPNERTGKGVYCPRCARVVATPERECPACPRSSDPFAKGPCPRCDRFLDATPLGDATAGRCPACAGTWLDRGQIFLALDLRTEAGKEAPTLVEVRKAMPPSPEDGPRGKRHAPCPRCRGPMTRRTAAPISGVLVDLCPKDGIWFDTGQFERFSAFVSAGGLELTRRELLRAEIDARLDADSAKRYADARARHIRRDWLGNFPLP